MDALRGGLVGLRGGVEGFVTWGGVLRGEDVGAFDGGGGGCGGWAALEVGVRGVEVCLFEGSALGHDGFEAAEEIHDTGVSVGFFEYAKEEGCGDGTLDADPGTCCEIADRVDFEKGGNGAFEATDTIAAELKDKRLVVRVGGLFIGFERWSADLGRDVSSMKF